jgi:hypothetical protein
MVQLRATTMLEKVVIIDLYGPAHHCVTGLYMST